VTSALLVYAVNRAGFGRSSSFSSVAMCWWGRDGTSCFAQLRLLLWKNWLLKKRRACATCCELLFPVGAVFILIIIRTLVKIDDVDDIIPIYDKASVRQCGCSARPVPQC
jgi:hypothetical protein